MEEWINVYWMQLSNKEMKIVTVNTVDKWNNRISKYSKITIVSKGIKISIIRNSLLEE